jgi:hypothetical protein
MPLFTTLSKEQEMRIAYSTMLFVRSITDGRSMMCSALTLSIGNNQRMVASSLARSSSRSRVCSQRLFGKVCEALWQAGDFTKDDKPQDNRVICQMNDSIPEVIEAMRACVKKTGASKLFSTKRHC